MGKVSKTVYIGIVQQMLHSVPPARAVGSALWEAAPLCQIVAEKSGFKSTTVKA